MSARSTTQGFPLLIDDWSSVAATIAITKPLFAAEARLAKLATNNNSMRSRGIAKLLRFTVCPLVAHTCRKNPVFPGKGAVGFVNSDGCGVFGTH